MSTPETEKLKAKRIAAEVERLTEQEKAKFEGKKSDNKAAEKSRKTITLEDVAPIIENTKWLWKQWVPYGYLSMIVGEQGYGKSMLALHLCRCIISNLSLPRCEERPDKIDIPIIWLDTEGGQAMLKERAEKWKIPFNKIIFPQTDSEDLLDDFRLDSEGNWNEIERLIKEHNPSLVVIDSLRGVHTKDENSSDMFFLLKRLSKIAQTHCIAVVVIHHANKSEMAAGLARVRGSSAITQNARSVMMIDRVRRLDPNSDYKLWVEKSNLAARPKPLTYSITEQGIAFGDFSAIAESISATEDAAQEILNIVRESGNRILSTEAWKKLEKLGIPKATAKRALAELKIKPVKNGKVWYWEIGNDPTT